MADVKRERREEAIYSLSKLLHADILHEDKEINRELTLLFLEATIRNFDSYGQHEGTNVEFPYALHAYEDKCAVMFVLGRGPVFMLFSLKSKNLPELTIDNLRNLTDKDIYNLRVKAKFACFGDVKHMPLWVAVKEAAMFESILSEIPKKTLKATLEKIRKKQGR